MSISAKIQPSTKQVIYPIINYLHSSKKHPIVYTKSNRCLYLYKGITVTSQCENYQSTRCQSQEGSEKIGEESQI